MKKIMLIISILATVAPVVLAVPAAPLFVKTRQPDGTLVTIRGYGDESYNFTETAGGYTVIRNGDWWEYAMLDASGAFIASGIRARDSEEVIEKLRSARIQRHLREADSVIKAKRAIHNDLFLGSYKILSQTQGKSLRRVLVLLVKYPDMDTTQSSLSFQQMINQDGWHSGSMNQYYQEVSYGQLSLNADYRPWIVSTQPASYYAYNTGYHSYRVKELVREAVDSAEANGVNFALYDNDNDGTVDGLFIVHVGPGAEEGGQQQYIWSHSSNLAYAGLSVVYDGKTIGPYIIMPETYQGDHVEIGVFCHEYGHALGLPDLYDTDGTSEGVGNYCLMGSGSWGGNSNSPQLPVHLSPWCKKKLGWLAIDTVRLNTVNYALPAVELNPLVLRIWTEGASGNQYFLVENRRKLRFDTNLPNNGLLIWHIDEAVSNNNNELHKKVDLECATGLIYGGGTKDYLDTTAIGWPRYNLNDYWCPSTGKTVFDPFTNPSSNNYTSGLTQVAVYGVRQSNGDTLLLDIFIGGSLLSSISYQINDASGNNNGIAEDGETVGLTVTLANASGWYNASSVSATLSTADTSVIITKATATFPNINNGGSASCAADSFVFQVKTGVFPHKVPFIVTNNSTPQSYRRTDTLMIPVGFPRVLVVDDDGGASYENYYTGSLDTVGAYYRLWSIAAQGSPSLAKLDSFPVVIWFTGDDSLATLTSPDTTNLKSYLDNGGKLFISSKQLGQQLGNTGFYHDYLKSNYISNNANQRILRGVAGNPIGQSISDTLSLGYAGGSPNYQSMDVIQPIAGADSCFIYRNSSNVAGVIFEGNYKLVYLAFPFEAMSGPDRYLLRNELMERILLWFGGVLPAGVGCPEGEPTMIAGGKYRLKAAPNPFRLNTTFYLDLQHGAEVSLNVFNYLGQRVASVHRGHLSRGGHRLQWNGRGQDGRSLAPGVYFVRLEVAGQGRETAKLIKLW